MIVLVAAAIATKAAAEAEEPPLPCGLRWGDARERCVGVLSAEGYSAFVRAKDYDPARSPDRMLRRVREAQGISVLYFEKKTGDIGETVTIHLYQGELFQISIAYDGTKKGFADKLVKDVSQSVSLAPWHIEGIDSKMETYVWAFPTTAIVLSCHYGASAPIPFAALEYRDQPLLNALKAKGLM